jgi:hypothetical protein
MDAARRAQFLSRWKKAAAALFDAVENHLDFHQITGFPCPARAVLEGGRCVC